MNQAQLEVLLEKYRNGSATAAEQDMLDKWYLKRAHQHSSISQEDVDHAEAEIWSGIRSYISVKHKNRKPKLYVNRIKIAASLIGILGLAVLFHQLKQIIVQHDQKNSLDIQPGRSKAKITLEGGKTVVLDTSKNGISFFQGLKYSDGSRFNDKISGERLTVSTPRGGTYQVTLSDGTRVWLNAASSLTFSTEFNTNGIRSVYLKGEAYFEVAKIHSSGKPSGKLIPFCVEGERQTVEVLGTHFNVSSYSDEDSLRTTLVEGSVKVTAVGENRSILLKPGMQSILADGGIRIHLIDTMEATAWKDGVFLFRNEPLQAIMRQISRWYDVEVVYEGKNEERTFEGSISRFKNIRDVLRKFELTGRVHFKIEGRRITVMP